MLQRGTEALHGIVLRSRSRLAMGMFVTCKNLALNIDDCDSDDHVSVGPVSFNWGRKRTIEDDMHHI